MTPDRDCQANHPPPDLAASRAFASPDAAGPVGYRMVRTRPPFFQRALRSLGCFSSWVIVLALPRVRSSTAQPDRRDDTDKTAVVATLGVAASQAPPLKHEQAAGTSSVAGTYLPIDPEPPFPTAARSTAPMAPDAASRPSPRSVLSPPLAG